MVEDCITERTRAIAVVHLFGHPARMGELLELAERHGLAVIEDAAQSIGATWHGRHTGTLGSAGVLSLNYHKIIHSGEGGVVLTDDAETALRARLYATTARSACPATAWTSSTRLGRTTA